MVAQDSTGRAALWESQESRQIREKYNKEALAGKGEEEESDEGNHEESSIVEFPTSGVLRVPRPLDTMGRGPIRLP